MLTLYLKLFCLGALDCFLLAIENKFIQKDKKTKAFIGGAINAIIWVTIISTFIQNLDNKIAITIYAMACGCGNVLGILFENYLDKLSWKKFRKQLNKRFKKKRK
jgi:uncharacterized protein YebE (UPF0316 family)